MRKYEAQLRKNCVLSSKLNFKTVNQLVTKLFQVINMIEIISIIIEKIAQHGIVRGVLTYPEQN